MAECDQETDDVQRVLKGLRGRTVWTTDRNQPNEIHDISDATGFDVQTKRGREWVPWSQVLQAYRDLCVSGHWINPKGSKRVWRGAFVRAVLVELTTVQTGRDDSTAVIYLREGRPVRLRRGL